MPDILAAMKAITLIGAGRVGQLVAEHLVHAGDYRLTVLDRSAQALAQLPAHPRLRTQTVDLADGALLAERLRHQFAVLNAAPFALAGTVAGAARVAGVHYLDLTEDVAATRQARALAEGAPRAVLPQCGLAPGFIAILGHDLAGRFERLHTLQLRVGALPEYPANALGYNLTWSPEGLINEYCEPCEAIVDGRRALVPALGDVESLTIDGEAFEAFNTSGGLGTLCETLAGRVQRLDYRSIRYPGHAAQMRLLLDGLRLRERREWLRELLEFALPATLQDRVLVFATATGWREGRFEQQSRAVHVRHAEVYGRPRSAIQIATAAGLCAALDLLAQGRLPQQGFVRQEDIALADFLNNRFGRVYADGTAQPLPIPDAA